ncbi:MAG: ABC transporter permease [Trueperaceae bacterium]|nr:ABC transporter permease [Trueperaceae bacterium]
MTAFLHAKPGWVRSLLVEGMLLLVLGILIIVMANLSPAFLTTRNLFNVTRFIAEIGLISLGMTMVILTGGIDLSVGSMLGMCGIVMGALFVAGTHVWLAALIAIALGGLAGFINGALTVATRVHPLVITLATLAIYRGIAQGIAQGDSYRGFPEVFFFLGQGYVGPFPTQLLLFAVLAALAAYVLGRTTFGRSLYAFGHNEVATRFAGIAVDRLQLAVYTATGVLCGLASVVFVSRVSSARGDSGTLMELDVITAVVLGGTALTGGRGSILGTLLGLLIIGVVRNGLTLAFVPLEVQAVFVGLILIAAVAVNRLLRHA